MSEKLFEVQQIEDTPFSLLIKDDEVQVVIGNNIVSPKFASEQVAKKWIASKPWELITATIGVICETIVNNNLNKK